MTDRAFRRAVLIVALLNLAYFGVEFAAAIAIGSVSLFADSVDFLEDASVNLLIAATIGWRARQRARVGMFLAGVLLVPAVATLWTAMAQISHPAVPSPVRLSLVGAGALVVNVTCALMLARYRTTGGSLTRAAFLSARNDAVANVGIVVTGAITASVWPSAWPDIIAGLGIMLMNADAAREVWTTATAEHRAAAAPPP